MSLLHINCRSLSQQFDELKHVLDSLPFTVDFLGCSETFITNSLAVDQFEITGYQLIMAYHRGQNSTFEFDVVVLQFLPRSAIQHSYQLNEIYSAIYSYSEISQTNAPQIIQITVSRIISLHPLNFSIFPVTYTVLDFIGHLDI